MPVVRTQLWAIPDGLEVAIAAADGLHLLAGSDDRIISPNAVDKVVADPAGGGWLVERYAREFDEQPPSTIHRIGDDGSDDLVLTADAGTFLTLHDAAMVDDHPTVFYNVNLWRDGSDIETLDEMYALDLVTGTRRKIADVGGWEAGVNVKYGGGILAGIWGSEAMVKPWSVDLDGNLDVVDVHAVGLDSLYSDDPAAPSALTISADGGRLSWVTPSQVLGSPLAGQQLVITGTDGSGRRDFTLPAGPVIGYDLDDLGDYLVVGSVGGRSALVDAASGGILVLPIDGSAAASGKWEQPPRWPIVSPVTEDVTEQIRALEPKWADAQGPLDEALAQALLGDDGGGECASQVRGFPGSGDDRLFIELRQFCDDSGAGYWYEVTVVDPPVNGSITGSALRRQLCWRGVSTDGVCV